jgi:hypothetical protein
MPWLCTPFKLNFKRDADTVHSTVVEDGYSGVLAIHANISIHPMALQPKLGLCLLCRGSITIMFYDVRL